MSFDYFRKWCMDKMINIIVVSVFLLFIIFIIFVTGISSGFQQVPVSARLITKIASDNEGESKRVKLKETILANNNLVLSNKRIEWGIKRNDNNAQPDLGLTNKNLIEKYNGLAIGNSQKPYIYLTFDVGYEGGYTNKILDVLNDNNVKATFFVTGQFVKTNPEIVKRMIDEEHIVGNHTENHKSMPDCSDETIKEEIMKLHKRVYEQFEYEMKYMRPPKGEYSEKSLNCIQTLGYKVVMWSFAYDDWENDKQGREEYGKRKIIENLHNGEVILLHATSKDNANILDYVIKEIKKQGYELKSLDEFE